MKIIRFIYSVLLLILVLTPPVLNGQQTPKTNYYGFTYEEDVDCFSNTKPTADDLKLERFITQMLEKIGTKNRITIKSCQSEENCAATIKDGVPYILYNPNFLKNTNLNFTTKSIDNQSFSAESKYSASEWELLTILAHEVGHHNQSHLMNQTQNISNKQKELEADEFSGFIIYLMGGSLEDAQRVMYKSIVPIDGNSLYPTRKERLSAIKTGYDNALSKYGSMGDNDLTKTPIARDVEGRNYKIIKVGNQSWMAENLKTSKFANGDVIPNVSDPSSWKELSRGGWTWFKNDKGFDAAAGKLYNGYAVVDPRGLCPYGWRVPTDRDWQNLIDFMGGDQIAGSKIKANFGWRDGGNGNNEIGFNALPGGSRKNNGEDDGAGEFGDWWTSTQSKPGKGWSRNLAATHNMVYRGEFSYKFGFSVRCVKE